MAANGEDSTKTRLVGRRGADNIVEVPPGITVIDQDQRRKIGELNENDETLMVACGGESRAEIEIILLRIYFLRWRRLHRKQLYRTQRR